MRQQILAALILCCICKTAQCSIVVIANRSKGPVSFRLETAGSAAAREFAVDSLDSISIPAIVPAMVSYKSAGRQKKTQIEPGRIYYFGDVSHREIDLIRIALSTPDPPAAEALPSPNAIKGGQVPASPSLTIPVKILYDDAEITTPKAWESRIKKRFDYASQFFKKHCFVEFDVVAVDSWHSDPSITALDAALSEFERVVDQTPARIAVGFTGRFKSDSSDSHLGGTRGPLHSHVLVREWTKWNTEQERTELLVHELAHLLGAVHSPEQGSVMRPVLGDWTARAKGHRLRIDPLNTMAMCLVSEQLNRNPLARFSDLAVPAKIELARIYVELTRANPSDPAAPIYLRRLGVRLPSVAENGSP